MTGRFELSDEWKKPFTDEMIKAGVPATERLIRLNDEARKRAGLLTPQGQREDLQLKRPEIV